MPECFPGAGIVPSHRHPLIAIEGLDGAGKSTQMEALRQHLGAETTKFPVYASETGKIILQMLLHPTMGFNGLENAYILQSLMTVNRLEMGSIIAEAVKKSPVLLDRYFASGLVYGQYDGLPLSWLMEIHKTIPAPDLYFLLDVPVEESFKRRPNREDAYEADERRLMFVRNAYLELWRREPSFKSINGFPCRWYVIDGTLPADHITDIIRTHVEAATVRLNP